MSQKIQCEQCGGDNFRLEGGFYFCSICQLQSQDIQERVMDEIYGGAVISTRKIRQDKQELPEQGSSQLSSIEIYNLILKGLVDELIVLGAPRSLKCIVLQLWASYLRKIEMAFTSMSAPKKPKFGIVYKRGDVSRFYKVRKPMSIGSYPGLVRKKKRPIGKVKSTSTRFSTDDEDTGAAKRKRASRARSSLARAEYDSTIMESTANVSQAPSLASLDLTQTSRSSADERIQYSKQGKKDIVSFLEQVGKEENKLKFHARSQYRHRNGIGYMRMALILPILRVALMLCNSDIHPGDLLRWDEEGHFSFYSASKFIPSHVKLTDGQRLLLLISSVQIGKINHLTAAIVKFLGVTNVGFSPSKIIINLVRRYCELFNLPDTVSSGIDQLLALKPPKVWLDSHTCNYEGTAMSFILFALKILIGLDDVTEYNYVPRKDVEGVHWVDWCQQFEAKMAEKAVNHFPTLLRQYPGSFVGQHKSLLSDWDPKNAPPRNSTWSKHQRAVVESMQKTMKPLACKLPESNRRLDFPFKRSGPPLAVLSESSDDSVRQKSINCMMLMKKRRYGKIQQYKIKPKDAPLLKVRVLGDEDKVPPQKEMSNVNVKQVQIDEGTSIWLYHPPELRHSEFNWKDGSCLPSSFWWLLIHMSQTIHQAPFVIYRELIKVEKIYCDKRRKNDPTKW